MIGLSKIHYRSVTDLNNAIVKNLWKIPKGTNLIVGIPRSGMLAANLFALHLNLPLTDLEGFLDGRIMRGGKRQKWSASKLDDFNSIRALVIDDSVNSGNAICEAKHRIAEGEITTEVKYGCVFLNSENAAAVDFFCEVCPIPRIFEWNLMHDSILEQACVDIDGVICRDPTEEENDDGILYREFISSVEPLIVPSVKMGYLVTSRLEKYRDLTEQWLAKHNFKYGELIMMDCPDKATRIAAGNHGGYKAAVYHGKNSTLFIESSMWQAQTILKMTGKSVFCMDTREMLTLGAMPQVRRVIYKIGPYILRRIKRAIGK